MPSFPLIPAWGRKGSWSVNSISKSNLRSFDRFSFDSIAWFYVLGYGLSQNFLKPEGLITTMPMHDHIDKVLFDESRILARLDEIAAEITSDYDGKELIVVPILHGGLILVADLLRRVKLPLKMECLSVESYHGGTESSGVVTFNQLRLPDLGGAHVLIIDDILDSGRTLGAIGRKVVEECKPADVRICVLLDKQTERAEEVCPDYVGFEVGDEFVIGYGLDYRGRYRNLPYIGTLKEEFI